jgi:hypothetical protein
MGGRLFPQRPRRPLVPGSFEIKKGRRHIAPSGMGAWNLIDFGPLLARQILVFVQSLMFGEAFLARGLRKSQRNA